MVNTAEYRRKDLFKRNAEIVVIESGKPTYETRKVGDYVIMEVEK